MVTGSSFGQETVLTRTNYLGKIGLDFIDNDFGDKLIGGVAKANGSEVPNVSSISAFRYDTKESGLSLKWHGRIIKNIST